MVFKRRDKLSGWTLFIRSIWPKGGWSRAATYMKHRLNRLPDTPHKIARGVFAGAFAAFTPFFGLHFLVAFLVAKLVRGNVLAALLGTFIGNPLTYVPIGVIAMKMGHFILGSRFDREHERSFVGKFLDAGDDLWRNLVALFTDQDANWDGLLRFTHEVFMPYLVGGIFPGIVAGLACYYISLPMISAYQHRRIGRFKRKSEERRRKAAAKNRQNP
ncbi:DUF2062 domain-containing protein [Celeribacter arenosi]|uniref:DUF2062 domain-containing protein n=1 Tax=Celeribacter arenosi TaxID=792649 RepID=A0ABP7JZM4_9RHOB